MNMIIIRFESVSSVKNTQKLMRTLACLGLDAVLTVSDDSSPRPKPPPYSSVMNNSHKTGVNLPGSQ